VSRVLPRCVTLSGPPTLGAASPSCAADECGATSIAVALGRSACSPRVPFLRCAPLLARRIPRAASSCSSCWVSPSSLLLLSSSRLHFPARPFWRPFHFFGGAPPQVPCHAPVPPDPGGCRTLKLPRVLRWTHMPSLAPRSPFWDSRGQPPPPPRTVNSVLCGCTVVAFPPFSFAALFETAPAPLRFVRVDLRSGISLPSAR